MAPSGGQCGGYGGANGSDNAAVETLQSIVEQLQELAEQSDSEEGFSSQLRGILERAGLETSQPILDYRA